MAEKDLVEKEVMETTNSEEEAYFGDPESEVDPKAEMEVYVKEADDERMKSDNRNVRLTNNHQNEEEQYCSLHILALNVIRPLPQPKVSRNMLEYTHEKSPILVRYATKLLDQAQGNTKQFTNLRTNS